jgi:hypothetical protein
MANRIEIIDAYLSCLQRLPARSGHWPSPPRRAGRSCRTFRPSLKPASPAMKAGGSSEDMRRYIAAETEKWGKVAQFAGVKPE